MFICVRVPEHIPVVLCYVTGTSVATGNSYRETEMYFRMKCMLTLYASDETF
jgi:hypothetical protein